MVTGATECANVIFMAGTDTWLISTIIPMRFISPTTAIPNAERPLERKGPFAESTQGRVQVCVRVMYLAPKLY